MPSPHKVAPRTVLISSRLDELGASRRAAFRAVHDEEWNPLLYEIEPHEWLAAQRRASRKEERRDQRSTIKDINERLTMNSLVNTADHFIGIYGTSLGDPSPQLNGLRPLEYEILRFLFGHLFRKSGLSDELLADVFSQSATPEGIHKARRRLQEALASICDKSTTYHEVFRDRMALFLKEPPSDVPTSSLMYSTIHRLRRSASSKNIHFFTSRIAEFESGAVVHWRPSSHLYVKIRRQIQRWAACSLPSASPLQGAEFALQIESEADVGYVLHVVKAIFYEGYNVRMLRLGLRSDGVRVMNLVVAPYLHAGKGLIKILRDIYHCRVRSCKRHDVNKVEPHSERGPLGELEIIVADRPGMLARALAALALLEMQVLDIHQRDVDPSKGPGRGLRNHVRIVFKKSKNSGVRKGVTIHKDFRYPKDSQFALDFIAADLASQPGFYSVILANIPSGI
jgi:hypothetical protein